MSLRPAAATAAIDTALSRIVDFMERKAGGDPQVILHIVALHDPGEYELRAAFARNGRQQELFTVYGPDEMEKVMQVEYDLSQELHSATSGPSGRFTPTTVYKYTWLCFAVKLRKGELRVSSAADRTNGKCWSSCYAPSSAWRTMEDRWQPSYPSTTWRNGTLG